MINSVRRFISFCILTIIVTVTVHPAFAVYGRTSGGAGVGDVARNLLEPVNLLSDFVHSACFIIGGSFLFACLVKYIEHRRNPIMVPMSTVVFLLIAGLFLILIALISIWTGYGQYSLAKL